MLPCIVTGDSIAVGVGHQMPECLTMAEVGLGSKAINYLFQLFPDTDTVVVSLGANDSNVETVKHSMSSIRAKIHANRVVWLVPGGSTKKEIITEIIFLADFFKDKVIFVKDYATPGELHPAVPGYKRIAEDIRHGN